MSGLCHETTEAVFVAALWIVTHRHEMPRPLVPALKARFGLSQKEACLAIAEANRRREDGGS
jgi:hypothetical protein